MSWTDVGKSVCPIARSLAVVGDRWTMLILRELFLRARRFEQFQAQTGMSSHLLSRRLKRLRDDGVIARRQYSTRPVRHEYRLTDKGRDLYAVLLSLKAWGEKWGGFRPKDEPALTIIHRNCGHEIGLELVCPSCAKPFGPRDTTAVMGSRFTKERKKRLADFQTRKQIA